QAVADDPREGVRQRSRHRRRRRGRNHHDVRIDGDDLVAFFGCGLAHFSLPIQLMLTVWPLIFIVALALTSMPFPDSIFESAEDFISRFCASSLIVPLVAESVMSFSLVIVIELLAVSITMLFFSLLSMISIVSLPSSSLSLIVWPLRDLIRRRLFLPSALSAGGLSTPFHSAPRT